MTAPLTIADVTRNLDEFLDGLDRAAADRWAMVRIVAAAIPADVDLDDLGAVSRSLLAARFCVADFYDCFWDALDLARERRGAMTRQTGDQP
jgi:hypothetical protein